MKRKSLENELKNLRYYLKEINNSPFPNDIVESRKIAHTLVGMIMTIHNLAKTGAYNGYNGSKKEIFELIEIARNKAIHYGYFNNFEDIVKQATTIVKLHKSQDELYFSQMIDSLYFPEYKYTQIVQNEKTEITEVFLPEPLYKFRSYKDKREIYIRKEDLITVTNKSGTSQSYLLKETDDEIIYVKVGNNETTKTSFNALMQEGFFKPFTLIKRQDTLTKSLSKILKELKTDPYKNIVARFKYDNRYYTVTAHNLLQDFIFNHTIEEKIAFDHFTLLDFDNLRTIEMPPISAPIKALLEASTLEDIFFIELYLKRYKMYSETKELCENDKNSQYSKQSLLTNLFEIGASSFSEKFLKADRTGEFNSFYHQYRNARNELAHYVSHSKKDKEILIKTLEDYSSTLYEIFSKIHQLYYKQKIKDPLYKFPTPIKEDGKLIINNKPSKFLKIKHYSIAKIINGKKYLKINSSEKELYVEMDGIVLDLNYNTFISNECLIPLNSAHFVKIDPNTQKVKTFKYHPESDEIIHLDNYLQTLLQAQDIYKSHPQYKRKIGSPCLCIITYLDKNGNPYCSEGVRNLLYRRISQKIVPHPLLEANTLVIPKDIDEPLQILNKNKVIVAKVYYACINSIDSKLGLLQILKDGKLKEIEFGRLLSPDLKTDELIMTTKEGEKR